MSPRVYVRKFDWGEARRLHDGGMSYAAIGREFGVSDMAVRFACDDEARAASHARVAAWQRSGVCPKCGSQSTRVAGGVSLRCSPCARRALVKTEDGNVYCPRCDSWKPRSEFSPTPSNTYRGVHGECRACGTKRRREHRHKNLEQQRAYQREYKRRRKDAA